MFHIVFTYVSIDWSPMRPFALLRPSYPCGWKLNSTLEVKEHYARILRSMGWSLFAKSCTFNFFRPFIRMIFERVIGIRASNRRIQTVLLARCFSRIDRCTEKTFCRNRIWIKWSWFGVFIRRHQVQHIFQVLLWS